MPKHRGFSSILVEKLVFISDPHIIRQPMRWRTDDVFETSLGKFEFVLKYCAKNKAALFIAGDLCDVPRDWLILSALTRLLKKYESVSVYVVFGQHDMYFRGDYSATIVGTLIQTGMVAVLLPSSPKWFVIGKQNIAVYGRNWEEKFSKLWNPDNYEIDAFKILVLHAPITPSKALPKQKVITPKRLVTQEGGKHYDFIFCGDIHVPFVQKIGGTTVANTGPMFRVERTEGMEHFHPYMIVLNFPVSKKGSSPVSEAIGIPHAPYKEVFKSKEAVTEDLLESAAMDDVVEEIAEQLRTTAEEGCSMSVMESYWTILRKQLKQRVPENRFARVENKLTELLGKYKDQR